MKTKRIDRRCVERRFCRDIRYAGGKLMVVGGKRMIKKRTLSLLFIGLLTVMLCSCSRKAVDPGVQKTEEGGLRKIFGTASNKLPKDIVEEGDYFYSDRSLDEGRLKYQINGSAIYDNIFDAGLKYEDLREVNGKVNPDTGEILDGMRLVLVEVFVESENAVNEVVRDFTDGITFRADYLELADISKLDYKNYFTYIMVYFSEAGECEQHPNAYKLDKGSSRSFTVGYLSFTDDTESLYLCTTTGHIDSTFVRLNFGAN